LAGGLALDDREPGLWNGAASDEFRARQGGDMPASMERRAMGIARITSVDDGRNKLFP
jgi:hypothetical protein